MAKTNRRATINPAWQQLEFERVLESLRELVKTPYGGEQIDGLIFSRQAEQVQRWLNEVWEMQTLIQSEAFLPLYEVPDIRPYLQAIRPENTFLEPRQLLDVQQNLQLFSQLRVFLLNRAEEAPHLSVYAEKIHTHRHLAHEIAKTVEPGADLRDDASPELRKIRREIASLESQLRRLLQKLQKRYAEYAQEDIVTLRDGRMVLGIKRQWLHQVNGIVHGTSASGATVFIEPMETLPLSNQIQSLRIEERTEIIRILRGLTDLVRHVREDLWFAIQNVGYLDSLLARARYSLMINGTRPQIASGKSLVLREARHPLLIRKMGPEKVVPLSLELGKDFTTLVITGPNAGGKTVALKTLGLLALMLQHGMLVPAHPDSQFPLYKNILADIGDRQSLEQDLSTFSAHVLRLKDILSQASENSLVLLDEIGTGTDPREGAALAMAILRRLTDRKVPTVATTHHGELKAFAHQERGMENASMEFDIETLQPTYRLRLGIPGSSYAFEIARRYGLPEEIIQLARRYLGEENRALEELILRLEEQLQALEQERRELNLKLTQAEALRKLTEKRLETLKKEKKKLQRQAAEEARQIVRQARAEIERLVAEIRASQAASESIKEARKKLLELENQTGTLAQETEAVTPEQPFSPQPGQMVWVEGLNTHGEVLTPVDDRGRVQILVGNVRSTVEASRLRPVRPEEQIRVSSSSTERKISPDQLKEPVPPELDVRGLDGESAIEAVDRFLSEAQNQGWKEVRIIHGKGSGRLRQRIHQFLARDKRVAEKRLGRWGEGDTGVTVIRLAE